MSRKGWERPGGSHLQLPWPLCTPLLLSQRQTRPRILEHKARKREESP